MTSIDLYLYYGREYYSYEIHGMANEGPNKKLEII